MKRFRKRRSARPPYRRSRKKEFWTAIIVVAVVSLRWLLGESDAPTIPERVDEGRYAVERVVDGDTLIIADPRRRVRLQGIDTPETVKEGSPVEQWGPEASAYTEQFVRDAGGQVRLEFGPERLDRFGRMLAFVWHEERLLNEELVRAGLAHAKLGYDYRESLKRRLRLAQREAQRQRRGVWSQP